MTATLRPATRAILVAALFVSACGEAPPPAPGVARELAERRAATISGVQYFTSLWVPAAKDSAVTGLQIISFDWTGEGEDVVIDFRAPAANVRDLRFDGAPVEARVLNDHIVIPGSLVKPGRHEAIITFASSDAALNRQDDFLYALFVPDRASTAIPVFEQPDLKATFELRLRIPAEWDAVSNGATLSRDTVNSDGTRVLRFAETKPIPTYLMSFAAGKLQRVTGTRAGRTFTMFHRETDPKRIARNADAIFDLHAAAIAWLEEYTGIPYPFDKYDFFAVPAFQFGGMEHPGAVWYRADGLLLDEAPSRTQELGRASLISHETAHMWFGDLVTMRWFDDVWMKEVFANFMASKIVTPSFPDVDHALRFFQSSQPAAYGVDRTAGANAIRQPLGNLREAGSLYGAVIYQKAPVVMKQLETLVGEATFREGLRTYLAAHKYGNATWPDLVSVLDSLSPEDVTAWSKVWVEEPGRPTIAVSITAGRLTAAMNDQWSAIRAAAHEPADAAPRRLRWPEDVATLIAWGDHHSIIRGRFRGDQLEVAIPGAPPQEPDLVLPGVDGESYGRFPLDERTREAILSGQPALKKPLMRAVAWQGMHEELMDGNVHPRRLLTAVLAQLQTEPDELVASQLTGLARTTYWRYLDDSTRRAMAPTMEEALWQALAAAPTPGRKGALFSAIIGTTLTAQGMARLERIWRKQERTPGFPLSESQEIAIAEGLALRGVPNAEAILDEMEQRITNPDRKARQRFMRAALSADPARRDSLFRTFAQVENRRRESWVLDAMGAMNHPLRAAQALPNLDASLALGDEIQRTGDIFFPLNWFNATLGGHNSAAAASRVQAFLDAHRDWNPRLRGKLLQAAHEPARAAAVLETWGMAPAR